MGSLRIAKPIANNLRLHRIDEERIGELIQRDVLETNPERTVPPEPQTETRWACAIMRILARDEGADLRT